MIDFGHRPRYNLPMARYDTLLVVDDDADVLTAARMLMKQHFRRVLTSERPDEIVTLMQDQSIDVFLVDMNFAIGRNTGAEGLKCLDTILAHDPDAVVVLMTAFGDLNTAVRAMREGAADFVLKPWQNDKLVATLKLACKLRHSRATVKALSVPKPVPEMIAESQVMQNVLRVVERVAPTDANVLITGENGTGKELIAQALHRQSARSDNVLISVDLGAISESLFESELFGHKKGAFTDAANDRAGRFQAAHHGTLFLDEIGNLPSALQTKLLRVIESREVVPLGSDQPVSIDVRLISATNQTLGQRVAEGYFRDDLLYRINTIEIKLPPLRERLGDILLLARHFVSLYSRKYHLSDKRFTAVALEELSRYPWPGNVRELSHAIERALILGESDMIDVGDLDLAKTSPADGVVPLNLEANEKRTIGIALEQAKGNISHAAEALGITRAALYRRIDKFSL